MPDKRARFRIKNSDGTYSTRWFETKANIVLFDDGTNVEAFKTTTNESLNNKAQTITYTATIDTTWSGSGPFTKTVTVSGIQSTDNPIVDIVLSDDTETAKAELEAYGKISDITTSNGSITIRCLEEKPESSFSIQLKVVR